MSVGYGPYNATVVRIVDGDTLIANVDCGFRVSTEHPIRIADINAPELFTSDPLERERGRAARSYLESICPPGSRVVLRTDKDRQSFNRYVGWLELPDGRDVGEAMVEAGHAVFSDG